jgi:hypothetical protein
MAPFFISIAAQTPGGYTRSMTATIPYLWLRAARDGKEIAYYRKQGVVRRVTTPDGRNLLPGDAGFDAAFAALGGGDVAPSVVAGALPFSLAKLIEEYQASRHWHSLAPLTREDYGRVFRSLNARYGDASVKALEPHAVRKLREFFEAADGKPTPARANKVVRVLLLLCEFARTNLGWRSDNPCLRPKRLPTGDGYSAWTRADFEQFMTCDQIGEPIKRGDVGRTFKAMAGKAGLTREQTARISGHSTCVGASQDTIRFGAELPGVMQAGRWNTPVMVARYTQRLTARRSAAVQIADRRKQF